MTFSTEQVRALRSELRALDRARTAIEVRLDWMEKLPHYNRSSAAELEDEWRKLDLAIAQTHDLLKEAGNDELYAVGSLP